MKNKRWGEYASDFLGWADPEEKRLWKLKHAFKAGYDACEKDSSQSRCAPVDGKSSKPKPYTNMNEIISGSGYGGLQR